MAHGKLRCPTIWSMLHLSGWLCLNINLSSTTVSINSKAELVNTGKPLTNPRTPTKILVGGIDMEQWTRQVRKRLEPELPVIVKGGYQEPGFYDADLGVRFQRGEGEKPPGPGFAPPEALASMSPDVGERIRLMSQCPGGYQTYPDK